MLIPKRIFAISKVAAKEQGRYATNGVCLQRTPDGRPLAIATDGRRLVAATWPEGKPDELPEGVLQGQDTFGMDEAIIPTRPWDEAGKAIPKYTVRPGLDVAAVGIDGRTARIGSTDLEVTKRNDTLLTEGKFPTWRKIVPNDLDGMRCIAFNPQYLAECAQVLQAMVGSLETPLVTLAIPKDPRKPAVLVAESPEGGTAMAVLMPINEKYDLSVVKNAVSRLTGGAKPEFTKEVDAESPEGVALCAQAMAAGPDTTTPEFQAEVAKVLAQAIAKEADRDNSDTSIGTNGGNSDNGNGHDAVEVEDPEVAALRRKVEKLEKQVELRQERATRLAS